jgi:hypothetical protein
LTCKFLGLPIRKLVNLPTATIVSEHETLEFEKVVDNRHGGIEYEVTSELIIFFRFGIATDGRAVPSLCSCRFIVPPRRKLNVEWHLHSFSAPKRLSLSNC